MMRVGTVTKSCLKTPTNSRMKATKAHLRLICQDKICDIPMMPNQRKVGFYYQPAVAKLKEVVGIDTDFTLLSDLDEDTDLRDGQELVFGIKEQGRESVFGSLRGDINQLIKKVSVLEEKDVKGKEKEKQQDDVIVKLSKKISVLEEKGLKGYTLKQFNKVVNGMQDVNDDKQLENCPEIIPAVQETLKIAKKKRNKVVHFMLRSDSAALKQYKIAFLADKWHNMPEAIRNKVATYYGDEFYSEIDMYLQRHKNDSVPRDSKPVDAVSKAEVDDWWDM